MLTMSYDDLAGRVGAATVIGSAQGGSLIAPETVRRLACDANVIPTVLGGSGEILEQGRSTRLATPGQLAALWLRDSGCTFPGCTTPAHWCDAHHLVHWADGGKTDLTNLALLCGRHHSVAHRDHLIGDVNAAGGAVDRAAVTWNVIPGSYDHRGDGPPLHGDLSSGDPPPRDPSTPPNCPSPGHGERHDPAPDAEPWADLWLDANPAGQTRTAESAAGRRHGPDAEPWADLWPDSGHHSDGESTDEADRHRPNPEADPWYDSGGPAA